MNLAQRIINLLSEEKWSGDVEVKHHPPEGLFANGSPKDIADWAWKASGKDLKKAMAALNFFVNRAGSKLPKEIGDKVEKAKDLLRKMAK